MVWSVDNQLDKLDVCIVGRAHEPEYYPKDIQNIIKETNQDLDNISDLLKTFGVKVLRPNNKKHFLKAPVTPRDWLGMIDHKFFVETYNSTWNDLRGKDWPIDAPKDLTEWELLDSSIKNELSTMFNVNSINELQKYEYANVEDIVNTVAETNWVIKDTKIDTAMIARLGKKLIVGTWPHFDYPKLVQKHFPNHEIHVVDSQGHLDGCISVVSDDLIISRNDIECNIPGFRTVYIDHTKHNGDPETVFDVNMLVIDRKNVLCLFENDQIKQVLNQNNVKVHYVNFRHYEFWDAGLHCLTSDLNRI